MTEIWSLVALGDLCEIRSGYAFKSSAWTEDGIPVLQIANIRDGRLDKSSLKYVGAATATMAAKFSTREGDILVAMTGYVGSVAKISTPEAGFLVNQRVGRIEKIDASKVSASFLYWALRLPASKSAMVNLANGSAQANLSAKEFAKIEIPLPPLAEQRRIAGVLGALDDLIETNQRLMEGLRALTRSVFRILLETPCSPAIAADVIDLKYGKSLPARDRIAGSIAVVSSAGIVGSHNQRLASGPGVVVGRKGTVGSVTWVSGDYFPIDTTFYVETDLPMLFAFLSLERMGLAGMNTDSAVPGLNRSNALSRLLSIPEQPALDGFISSAQVWWSAAELLEGECRDLRRTRDELLPLLLSGRVSVREVAA